VSRRVIGLLLLLAACRGSLSPLSNKIEVGKDPYVVFTADGEGGVGDLFASPLAGEARFQITFTRVDERHPALSPDGSMLIFVRSQLPGDTGELAVVVMNLLNGAERKIALPPGYRPDATAWSADGRQLLVRAAGTILAAPAPPVQGSFTAVDSTQRASADSEFAVLLGEPALAMVVPCASGTGVCARLADGSQATVAADGTSPTRWPGDSIAYLEGDVWTVRPLAGGKTRLLRWSHGPSGVRELTTFRGAAKRE
jgi:hypothetical protein